MDDRARIVVSTVVGAVLGGVVGYLYLTENGRRVREQIEPAIDDFVSEVRRLRVTVDKARSAADESLRSLNELIGDETGTPRWEGGSRASRH